MDSSASLPSLKDVNGSDQSDELGSWSLEEEFEALRDENLNYEDDLQFHAFINALRLAETLVPVQTQFNQRKRSVGKILATIRRHL